MKKYLKVILILIKKIKEDLTKSNEINENNSLFNNNALQFQNNS